MIIRKNFLALGKIATQGLDDTMITAKAKYSNNLSRSKRTFYFILHYNKSNSFLFVNATKMNHFKAKDSERKPYPLCLGNFSKDFVANNMKKKKTELNR